MEALPPEEGLGIAHRWLPRLECEVATFRDFPCSIDFAWRQGQPLGPFEYEPPLYWWVKQDADLTVCGYCVYHFADTNHRHDFTGLVLFVDNRSEETLVALRSHFDLPIYRVSNGSQVYRIEEGAHPIALGRCRPDYSRWLPKWRLIPENCLTHPGNQLAWSEIRKRFAPAVTLPVDWDDKYLYTFADTHLQEWCGLFPDRRLRVTRGLIYNDPKSFLLACRQLGRIQ